MFGGKYKNKELFYEIRSMEQKYGINIAARKSKIIIDFIKTQQYGKHTITKINGESCGVLHKRAE